MSYILEALRKSQQERELGHVPTLDTSVSLSEAEGARPSLWILSALILAALAVVIALYSALRGAPQPQALQTATTVAESAGTRASDKAEEGPTAGTQPTSATAAPPRRPVGTPPQEAPAEPEALDPSVVMEAPVATPPQRPGRKTRVAAEPSTTQARGQEGVVPPDLIADIEAFKREVRAEQSGAIDATKAKDKVSLRDLRLPRDVRKRLPEFVMSAHIYDKEPSKRFVLINGLKTREGEESREGIGVEQILPDGALLSFDGHEFFQRR